MRHGLGDAGVAAAPADVPAEPFVDVLECRLRLAVEQRSRRHDETGGAVAALQRRPVPRRALFGESPDHRIVEAQPLDGHDVVALGRHGEHQAGEYRLAVHDHRAGAAGPLVTGQLQPGQPREAPEARDPGTSRSPGHGPGPSHGPGR